MMKKPNSAQTSFVDENFEPPKIRVRSPSIRNSDNSRSTPPFRRHTERVFVKSPTPMRELPSEILKKQLNENNRDRDRLTVDYLTSNNNRGSRVSQLSEEYDNVNRVDQASGSSINENKNSKNRNRFNRKKAKLRSQSLELSRVVPKRASENIESTRMRQSEYSSSTRPNLTRQNAYAMKVFTKSWGEDINKLSASKRQNESPPAKHSHQRHSQPTSERHQMHRHQMGATSSRKRHSSSLHHHSVHAKFAPCRSSSLDLSVSDTESISSQLSVSSSTSFSSSSTSTPSSSSRNVSHESLATLGKGTRKRDGLIVQDYEMLRSSAQNLNEKSTSTSQSKATPSALDKVKTSFGNLTLFNNPNPNITTSKNQSRSSSNVLKGYRNRLTSRGDFSSDDSICGIPKSSKKFANKRFHRQHSVKFNNHNHNPRLVVVITKSRFLLSCYVLS